MMKFHSFFFIKISSSCGNRMQRSVFEYTDCDGTEGGRKKIMKIEKEIIIKFNDFFIS